jgi:hypothetical protein
MWNVVLNGRDICSEEITGHWLAIIFGIGGTKKNTKNFFQTP